MSRPRTLSNRERAWSAAALGVAVALARARRAERVRALVRRPVEKRALLICRHDFWPALTPDRLWQLPYDMWASLALSCDEMKRQRAEERAELERMRTRR